MPCYVPDLLYTLHRVWQREYNSDQGVDHWTTVKIILSGIRICFSIMEVTNRFVVKGYIDANFDTDPDDSKSQSGYILKVGAIS